MAETIERGNIYFAFRPKVEERSPEGLEDIQRFYMVLSPHGKQRYRLVVIGQKKLPEIRGGGQRFWGFVEKVGRDAKDVENELDREVYRTKTRGERHVPAARPAGEGRYAIVRHDDHTHLAYALELPREPRQVQRELNIEDEGSYVASIKNPDAPPAGGAGLDRGREARYPKKLKQRFGDRKFVDVDPPDFLDHEGAELLLIGAGEDVSEELGIRLEPQKETEATAEIFNDLRMERSKHPLKPLFEGKWD